MVHRRTALAVLSIAAACALTSCGLSGDEAQDKAETEVTGDVEGKITFQTLQLSPTFDDYISGVIDSFEKKYPGTEVVWTDIPSESAARKTNADAVAGKLPDVMDLGTDTIAPLARKGLLLDMEKNAAAEKATFVDAAWKSLDFGNGRTSSLPWYLNTPVLIKNSSLLDEAGLGDAPDPTTYSELVDAAERIAQKTEQAGFQPTEIGLPNNLLSLGAPLVSEDGKSAKVKTPETVAFIESLAALHKSGGIPADSVAAKQRGEIETFQEGKLAYLESGGSRLKIIQENAPKLYQQITLGKPLGTDGTWMVAHGLAVPTSSKNQATALAFAKFMASPENQLALAKQSSVFPSTEKSLKDDFFQAQGKDLVTQARAIAAGSLLKGRATVRPAAVDAEYATALWKAVQPAILGEKSADQALTDAETKLTTILSAR